MLYDVNTNGEWLNISKEYDLEIGKEHTIRFNKMVECGFGATEPTASFFTNKIKAMQPEGFYLWVKTPKIEVKETEVLEEVEELENKGEE